MRMAGSGSVADTGQGWSGEYRTWLDRLEDLFLRVELRKGSSVYRSIRDVRGIWTIIQLEYEG